MYTIRPIFHGVFIDFDKSLFTYKQDPGVKIDVPLVSYLVEGDGLTVLVDAGPPKPGACQRHDTPEGGEGYLPEGRAAENGGGNGTDRFHYPDASPLGS